MQRTINSRRALMLATLVVIGPFSSSSAAARSMQCAPASEGAIEVQDADSFARRAGFLTACSSATCSRAAGPHSRCAKRASFWPGWRGNLVTSGSGSLVLSECSVSSTSSSPEKLYRREPRVRISPTVCALLSINTHIAASSAGRVAPIEGVLSDARLLLFGEHFGKRIEWQAIAHRRIALDDEDLLAAQRPRGAAPLREGARLGAGHRLERQDVAHRGSDAPGELVAQAPARAFGARVLGERIDAERQVRLVAKDAPGILVGKSFSNRWREGIQTPASRRSPTCQMTTPGLAT